MTRALKNHSIAKLTLRPKDMSNSSSDANATPKATMNLLKLPSEIRDIIYEFALLDLPISIMWQSRWPARQLLAPSIKIYPSFSFANRQMYLEILPIIIRTRNIILCGSQVQFSAFLRRIPNDPFLCIRKLTLSHRMTGLAGIYRPVIRGDSSATVAGQRGPSCRRLFLSKCTALRELTVEVHYTNLIKFVEPITTNRPETILCPKQEVCELLDLGCWFLSCKLEVFRLRCLTDHMFLAACGNMAITSTDQLWSRLTEAVEDELREKPGTRLGIGYASEERALRHVDFSHTGYLVKRSRFSESSEAEWRVDSPACL